MRTVGEHGSGTTLTGLQERVEERGQASPERTSRRRVELLVAVALMCVYFAVMSGRLYSMDGLFMYRQAWAIAFDHSIRFETPVWIWKPDPVWNSKYGIGLSLLYLPGILLFRRWFGDSTPVSLTRPEPLDQFYWSELYLDRLYTVGGAWVHAVVVAVTAYLLARLVAELGGSRRASVWAMLFYGLGSSAFVYAKGDFAQPLEGLCWVAAFLAAARFRRTGARRDVWLASAAVWYAVLTRPVEGSLLVPAVLALVALDLRPGERPSIRIRTALPVVGLYGLAFAITLLVNWARFGSPFVTGYEPQEGWRMPDTTRVLGVLVSPARGIIWEFPALVLAPLGFRALWRTSARWVAVAMVALAGVQLANVATWLMWWGGWNWGLRLFGPAIPLLAVLAGFGASALGPRTRRWLPGLLLLAGIAWAAPGIVTDLLGGYGLLADGPEGSWRIDAFPPYGAWQFLERWSPRAEIDWGSVDNLWVRLTRTHGDLVLLVPALLLGTAAVLAGRAWQLARR